MHLHRLVVMNISTQEATGKGMVRNAIRLSVHLLVTLLALILPAEDLAEVGQLTLHVRAIFTSWQHNH